MVKYYIGVVHDDSDQLELQVKILRRAANGGFEFLDNDDMSSISQDDIMERLPKPFSSGSTARTKKNLQSRFSSI